MNAGRSEIDSANEYWEQRAGSFSELYTTRNFFLIPNRIFLNRRMRVLRKFIGVEEESVVLDAGCGSGEFTEFLAHYYGRVIGLDYSSIMINLAKRNPNKNQIEYLRAQCDSIPMRSKSANRIFSLGLLDYVPDLENTFQEFSRILKIGGKLVVTVPKTPSFFAPLRWSSTIRQKLFNIPPIVSAISRNDVHLLIEKSGMEMLDLESLWGTMWIVYARKL